MMSEDRQPNEARSSWKGSRRVPAVRETHPHRSMGHTKPEKRSSFAASQDYPSKRHRAQVRPNNVEKTHKKSQKTNILDAAKITSGTYPLHKVQVAEASLPAPHHIGKIRNPAELKNDLTTCFLLEPTKPLNGSLARIPAPVAQSALPRSLQVDNESSAVTGYWSTQAEPDSYGVSPLSGPPRFRSGKINIDYGGPAMSSYNDPSDISLFWDLPPIHRPISPPLITPPVITSPKNFIEISSVPIGIDPIDLTTDEDQDLHITFPQLPIPSSSRLPLIIPRRSPSRSSSPDPLNITDPAPPVPTGFSTGIIRSGPLFSLARRGHDKPRRLLDLYEGDKIANVSMHGFVDKICVKPTKQRRIIREPDNSSREMINDACSVKTANGKLVVLGHARDNGQVSIFKSDEQSLRFIGLFDRPQLVDKTSLTSGISTLCNMLHPLKFATGGFDHTVNIWDIDEELFASCKKPLLIKHTATIHSLLAIRDSSHKLLSAGADCTANVYDLSSERVVNTIKTSNSIHHIYRTTTPFCTLFQVSHREHQFELRDHRIVPREPIQRFGFDCSNQKIGRYPKGDVETELFAYGDKDGFVRVWDLRNVQNPLVNIQCLPGKIAHVVFHRSRLVASSEDNQIATISYSHCSAA